MDGLAARLAARSSLRTLRSAVTARVNRASAFFSARLSLIFVSRSEKGLGMTDKGRLRAVLIMLLFVACLGLAVAYLILHGTLP